LLPEASTLSSASSGSARNKSCSFRAPTVVACPSLPGEDQTADVGRRGPPRWFGVTSRANDPIRDGHAKQHHECRHHDGKQPAKSFC
jgi:hypothetical protein